jgi:hypothetical protein
MLWESSTKAVALRPEDSVITITAGASCRQGSLLLSQSGQLFPTAGEAWLFTGSPI